MRRAHKLARNHSQAAPRYLVFFDSESRVTEEGEHQPYLICGEFWDMQNPAAHRKKEYRGAENLPLFWGDVITHGKQEKCSVWVFAHNAGYDVLATAGIPALVGAGFRVHNFFEKGSTYILSLKKTAPYVNKDGEAKTRTLKTVHIISSTNFYTTTLAALGKIFGLDKLDFDYEHGTEAEALIYCRRDVEILRLAVLKFMDFVKVENLGVLGRTTPGQAFNAYRHRFMPEPILLHDNTSAVKVERGAYYGGRVECFLIGEYSGDFYGFDINSMYPHVMKVHNYPTQLISYRKRGKLSDLKTIIDRGMLLCAQVLVEVDRPVFPVKLEGNLLFPTGSFWTYLSTPEILYGLEHDLIKEVGEFSIYLGANIFADYVDYFYTKRLAAKAAGDAILDLLYKLFLNSLYGKFGQKSETWDRIKDAPPDEVWAREVLNLDTKDRESFKCFGGSIFKKGAEVEAFNSFCAVASHVTAYARMHLYQFIKSAGWENIMYMDTDSLFVTTIGAARLEAAGVISETELGAMKLEKQDTSIKINAPKDYRFAGVSKMKGVKRGSQPITDPEELKSLGALPGRAFVNTQWPKLFSFIRGGDLSVYKNIKRTKVLGGDYNKGWLVDDGTVLPFELAVRNGENYLIPWPQTYHAGLDGKQLLDDGQQKKIYKRYRRHTSPPEAEQQQSLYKVLLQAGAEQKKEFRRAVMALGGVSDPDYEILPRWCKRKKGAALDVLCGELRGFGFYYENANELFTELTKN